MGFLQLAWIWLFRRLWQFARGVREFRTIEDGRVILHYEPGLECSRDLHLLLRSCREDHDRLARQFQFTLRRRPVIYLFRHYREIQRLFGPEYAGAALIPATAVVVADNQVVSEVLRHELVHLFAARWGVAEPPLLGEGVAVWLQGTEWGETIDNVARPLLLQANLKLD